MRTALIGHTGFIGGNLARQFDFEHRYNSSNIGDIRGREFDLLVCGGVTAVKWWANQNAVEDRARIDSLLAELRAVRSARTVVLSTVDVYPFPCGVDETSDCHTPPNHAYGTNRLYFEDEMRALFAGACVVRIGAVFGPGLKKNVIYDLMQDNCLDAIQARSGFQYYNVERLWRDIESLYAAGIELANLVTEPLLTSTILAELFPTKAVGKSAGPEVHYDVRTRHSGLLGGPPGYAASADEVLRELGEFVRR